MQEGTPSQSFTKWLKKVPSIAFGVVIASIFILVGLRSCVVTVWSPPEERTTYSIKGDDDRFMQLTFLPDGKGINIWGDPTGGSVEVVLYELRGVYATHHIWRIWNISREGNSLLGLRIAPKNAKPVIFEYDIINKWHTGFGESVFPPIGKLAHTTCSPVR